jgi:hypothetical protein
VDTNQQIISDLLNKIGSHQPVDFISDWKGVPVVITGHIHEVRENSIVFQVEAPDSICFAQDEHALILHDVFIMGIQGRILAFDPQKSIAELGEFNYVDRGFGGRSMVRVEPEVPIPGVLVLEEATISCQVIDISLNGFGLLAESTKDLKWVKGQTITVRISLLDQEIEVPGTLLGIFPKEKFVRLAMLFSQNMPNRAIITRYIAERRVEIRREIQSAYKQAVVQHN